MKSIYKGKKILVTGGTGSIGSEIVRALLKYEPNTIRILSNDESGLFNLEQELGTQNKKKVRYLLGDVRDKERLILATEDIDIIFHAAALKHVPLCEYNPFEAINTNVHGTQNIIEAALTQNVDKCILLSTDKAVDPTTVMGATKLLAERLIILANYYKGNKRTIFSVVRFGNVLNSRGSLIPLIKKQIMKGGPVTITDSNMTRFIMSISQAVDLIFKATAQSRGGEIFVLKMHALKIGDLIDVTIEKLAPIYGYDPQKIEKEVVGPRIREKYHEELISEAEAKWALEEKDMYIIFSPIEFPEIVYQRPREELKEVKFSETIRKYSSNDVKLLNKKEIKHLLNSIELV